MEEVTVVEPEAIPIPGLKIFKSKVKGSFGSFYYHLWVGFSKNRILKLRCGPYDNESIADRCLQRRIQSLIAEKTT